MLNQIPVTTGEIVAELQVDDAGGPEGAAERIRARKANQPTKPAAPKSPWAVDPSPELVRERQALTGYDYETAYADVKMELENDARRLSAFDENCASEINAALEASAAAAQRASDLQAEKESVLAAITGLVQNLGTVRRKISVLAPLLITPQHEKTLAKTAIDFFLDKKISGFSQANSGGFTMACDDLIRCAALRPHVEAEIEKLEASAKAIIVETRSEAKKTKVDLKKVIALFLSERHTPGNFAQHWDTNWFRGLV